MTPNGSQRKGQKEPPLASLTVFCLCPSGQPPSVPLLASVLPSGLPPPTYLCPVSPLPLMEAPKLPAVPSLSGSQSHLSLSVTLCRPFWAGSWILSSSSPSSPTQMCPTPWPLSLDPALPLGGWGDPLLASSRLVSLPPSLRERPSRCPSPWLLSPRLPGDWLSASCSRLPCLSCSRGGRVWKRAGGAHRGGGRPLPPPWSLSACPLSLSPSLLCPPSGPWPPALPPSPLVRLRVSLRFSYLFVPPSFLLSLSLSFCFPPGHSPSFGLGAVLLWVSVLKSETTQDDRRPLPPGGALGVSHLWALVLRSVAGGGGLSRAGLCSGTVTRGSVGRTHSSTSILLPKYVSLPLFPVAETPRGGQEALPSRGSGRWAGGLRRAASCGRLGAPGCPGLIPAGPAGGGPGAVCASPLSVRVAGRAQGPWAPCHTGTVTLWETGSFGGPLRKH